MAEYHDNTSHLVTTSLLLRAQTQAILQKFSLAQKDLQRILDTNSEHKQAQQMLRQVMKQQKDTQKRDKVLAKEVCKWVETASENSKPEEAPQQVKMENTQPSSFTTQMWSYFTCSTLE